MGNTPLSFWRRNPPRRRIRYSPHPFTYTFMNR
jgi:hypothetical protein